MLRMILNQAVSFRAGIAKFCLSESLENIENVYLVKIVINLM